MKTQMEMAMENIIGYVELAPSAEDVAIDNEERELEEMWFDGHRDISDMLASGLKAIGQYDDGVENDIIADLFGTQERNYN